MNPRPLVSVIVPTYDIDRRPRLRSALASIWAQEELGERFDLEPIVVDDGSTGPTEEVVRDFPGTRYIRFESNRGQAAARNAGLREATGKYVAFLDDDDLWLPQKLRIQVPVLEQARGVEVVYSQFVDDRPDGTLRVVPRVKGPSGWIFDPLFKETILILSTILVPRVAFETVGGFDESLSGPEDRDMWSRLALELPFRFVPGVVAVYLRSVVFSVSRPDDMIRWLLICRDKTLPLVQGKPNEAEITRLVVPGTEAHIAWIRFKSGSVEESRRFLIRSLAQFPIADADPWYGAMMKELATELAIGSGSINGAKSLCSEIRQVIGGGSFKHRLRARAFLAEIWISVALRRGSSPWIAASAAVKAIIQDPRKLVSRPGLIRVMARAVPAIPIRSAPGPESRQRAV